MVYKTRSIYNIFFTGDADIPFILPGGGKSNSPVGCIAPFSIQEVPFGHVFLSTDGFYLYDGINASKISDKITTTLESFNDTRFPNVVSSVQLSKNKYICAFSSSGQTEHNRVVTWDWFNNAWSVYVGKAPSAMAQVFVSGTEERPYFSDYAGYTYRDDTGSNDEPEGTSTPINAFYKTNWRHYGDIVNQKGVPQIDVYTRADNTVMTLGYSYDFEDTDTFSQTFSVSLGGDVYGTAVYGTGVYGGAGGIHKRRDLTSRGRVIRFNLSNNVSGEGFRIDGIGALPHLETNV